MRAVMIAIEGVLAREDAPFPAAQPIDVGLRLYHSLRASFNTVALACSQSSPEKVNHWLEMQGIKEYSYLLCRDAVDESLDVLSLRTKQLDLYRSQGLHIDFVVDASPDVVAMALHKGAIGVLFAHPKYARPEFRPDAPRDIRQWSSIEAEIDRQVRLKGRDQRLSEE